MAYSHFMSSYLYRQMYNLFKVKVNDGIILHILKYFSFNRINNLMRLVVCMRFLLFFKEKKLVIFLLNLKCNSFV